jgi:CBS domain-containing protein
MRFALRSDPNPSHSQEQPMKISRIMKRTVHVCNPEETASAALSRMDRFDHDALPVVDRLGRLVGLVTREVISQAAGNVAEKIRVETVMQRRLSCCRPTDSLSDLVATMDCLHLPHVPIIDDRGYLRGVVSAADLPGASRPSLGAEPLGPPSIQRAS